MRKRSAKPRGKAVSKLKDELASLEKQEIQQLDRCGPQRLIKIETLQTEPELFETLVATGAASYSGYHHRFDIDKGLVMLTQNDRAPAACIRIGIAGNCVYVSEKWALTVRSWLKEGSTLKASVAGNFIYSKFLGFLTKERLKTSTKKTCSESEKRVRQVLGHIDKELLAMCGG